MPAPRARWIVILTLCLVCWPMLLLAAAFAGFVDAMAGALLGFYDGIFGP